MTDPINYLSDFIRGIDATRLPTAQDDCFVRDLVAPFWPLSAASVRVEGTSSAMAHSSTSMADFIRGVAAMGLQPQPDASVAARARFDLLSAASPFPLTRCA